MTKEKVIELLDSWYKHDMHTERIADEIWALFYGSISVCPLCNGKGRRVFPNCNPPVNEVCPACKGAKFLHSINDSLPDANPHICPECSWQCNCSDQPCSCCNEH